MSICLRSCGQPNIKEEEQRREELFLWRNLRLGGRRNARCGAPRRGDISRVERDIGRRSVCAAALGRLGQLARGRKLSRRSGAAERERERERERKSNAHVDQHFKLATFYELDANERNCSRAFRPVKSVFKLNCQCRAEDLLCPRAELEKCSAHLQART